MTNLTINQPKIKLHDGIMATTSLNVAEVFGRRHKDVIRKLENLDCSTNFYERNFTPIQNEVSLGKGRTRQDKAYEITRDGFTFLAMGFTGAKAAAFKEAYIEAFNAMESELLKKYKQTALPNTITPKQKLAIRDAVAEKVFAECSEGMRKVGFRKVYHDFYEAFGISTYGELPAESFDSAMKYLLGEWVPESEALAIPDDMILVHRGNFKALQNRVKLIHERHVEIRKVEKALDYAQSTIRLAESTANTAFSKFRDFQESTTDPVREANMLANTILN